MEVRKREEKGKRSEEAGGGGLRKPTVEGATKGELKSEGAI